VKYAKCIISAISSVCLYTISIIGVHAETNQDKLNNVQQQLQQNNNNLQQKEREKKQVQQELQAMKSELQSVNNAIADVKEDMMVLENKITQTNQLIEKKKEEIVQLEDQIVARKDVMKQRMISMQNNETTNLLIDILINSESLTDLLEKMSAAATILDADKQILKLQQADMQQIERDKEVIKQQEAVLEANKEKLSLKQAELEVAMQQKQAAFQAVQTKYAQLVSEITLAEQEKKQMEESMNSIQASIAREQAAVNAVQAAQAVTAVPTEKAPAGKKELYVTATAYSVEKSLRIGEGITKAGYNLAKTPNIKLIAVDPNIIPLGKRVWVEGYGEAIAGDTGSAIINHKIDILVQTEAQAFSWGRRTVKIIILD
jgi:peptidoglycan hydrolase CwlO-like protein